MAFDIAKEHLEKLGLGDRMHTFEVSSATVELAAQAVGCEISPHCQDTVLHGSGQPDTGSGCRRCQGGQS